VVTKSTPAEAEHADLGAQLSAAAKKLGLSAYQLSIRSGVPAPSVRAALAGGNITLSSLRLIARALGLRKLKMRDLEMEMSAGVIDPGVAASTLGLLDEAVRVVTESRAAVADLVEESHSRGEMSRLVEKVDMAKAAMARRNEASEKPKGE
jgi:lambda repressor-like predicted transcriptional regulator